MLLINGCRGFCQDNLVRHHTARTGFYRSHRGNRVRRCEKEPPSGAGNVAAAGGGAFPSLSYVVPDCQSACHLILFFGTVSTFETLPSKMKEQDSTCHLMIETLHSKMKEQYLKILGRSSEFVQGSDSFM